jgi:hypothetical protein
MLGGDALRRPSSIALGGTAYFKEEERVTPFQKSRVRTSVALPDFRLVIWLMPAAFLLHIVEEYVGGFPRWATDVLHGSFNNVAFALNNAAFVVILTTLVFLNHRRAGTKRAIALVAFASGNLFWDALFHLFTTSLFDRYSPGLVTAMLLYYPLCLVIGFVIVKQRVLPLGQFVAALVGGLVLFTLVVWYGLFHFEV